MSIMEDRGRLTTCLTFGFRVHPNYGNDLRRQYNQVLHELAKSDILASIASQITGGQIKVEKYNDIAGAVLEANYALS